MAKTKIKSLSEEHIITTKRLLIRPLRISDFEVWKSAHSQVKKPRNRFDKTHLAPSKLTRRHFQSLLKKQAKNRIADQLLNLAIFDRTSGEMLGGVYIFVLLRFVFKHGMIGYYLFGKNWGQGIAYEANFACIQYAFKHFDLHRLIALIDKTNIHSNALARRLGMKFESVMSQSVFEHGRWKNCNCWVLLNKKN